MSEKPKVVWRIDYETAERIANKLRASSRKDVSEALARIKEIAHSATAIIDGYADKFLKDEETTPVGNLLNDIVLTASRAAADIAREAYGVTKSAQTLDFGKWLGYRIGARLILPSETKEEVGEIK